jgi:S-adenosylmethionine:tRNA ribosyltransferase-isomerase
MRTDLFTYSLPDRLIARHPAPVRDASRLLVLRRSTGAIEHHAAFRELVNFLRPGDVLVMNNSRVFPARLRGRKEGSGGAIELLLLEDLGHNEWRTLLRPGKRVRNGTRVELLRGASAAGMTGEVLEKNAEGHCRVRFSGDVAALAETIGQVPLPPYIDRPADDTDRERYQTVFAAAAGSVAAPTAGLHFTHELLSQIKSLGVETVYVTLHVGLGTFAPVKAEALEDHPMHEERFFLDAPTAAAINAARQSRRRVIAVGTTTVRVLESVAAAGDGLVSEMAGRTRIFIYPPYRFRVVDALITNFHLPQSTLLMLVSAFASPGELTGRELVMAAYAEAVRLEYRFFSYGDAMLIA